MPVRALDAQFRVSFNDRPMPHERSAVGAPQAAPPLLWRDNYSSLLPLLRFWRIEGKRCGARGTMSILRTAPHVQYQRHVPQTTDLTAVMRA
jgi:hypothetical protein